MSVWWWILIVVAVGFIWFALSMCRVAAKADEDWDRIVAELDAKERERGEGRGPAGSSDLAGDQPSDRLGSRNARSSPWDDYQRLGSNR